MRPTENSLESLDDQYRCEIKGFISLVAEAVELHNEDGFREYMLRGGLTI
jgi:hypothetical protein